MFTNCQLPPPRYQKAVSSFRRATVSNSPEVIVDNYRLVNDEKFRRKVERLGAKQREAFLDQRALLRERLIYEQSERQRLRSLVARSQLIRLYLILDDPKRAHFNLCESFNLCTSSSEHSEMLKYIHCILKEFSVYIFYIFKRYYFLMSIKYTIIFLV